MKKSTIFLTFLLMLGIGLLNPLHAQSQMVKTLNDPGSAPVVEFNFSEGNLIINLGLLATLGGPPKTIYNIDLTKTPPSIFVHNTQGYSCVIKDTSDSSQFLLTESSVLNAPYTKYSGVFTWDAYEASLSSDYEVIYPVFGPNAEIIITTTGGGETYPAEFGTNGTPITFTAEELAALNDANGRSFIMKQTATNATSIVNIPAQADAAAIGQAIKTAGIPHTIYIQPEIQDDGSLEIYADESFTLEGDPILSSPLQISSKQKGMLYPNPTSELLHLDHNTAKELDYVVYDLTGKRVQSTTCSGTQHVINVSPIAPGVYILETHTSQQKNQWRFVKE